MIEKEDKYSKRVAVKVILLSQLLSEAIDECTETTFYNHSLKNLLGKVANKLQPFNRENYDAIYDEDVADSIDVLDTILDQLTHCEVEGFNPIESYNLYSVRRTDGKTFTVRSTLGPKEFNEKYKTQSK